MRIEPQVQQCELCPRRAKTSRKQGQLCLERFCPLRLATELLRSGMELGLHPVKMSFKGSNLRVSVLTTGDIMMVC